MNKVQKNTEKYKIVQTMQKSAKSEKKCKREVLKSGSNKTEILEKLKILENLENSNISIIN